jgi:molybdopterin converting factor small subunit
VACTKDPLTYKEMGILRSLIWKFFKQKKRLRFTLERNVDMEDNSSRKISTRNTTISKEGRFIRQYTKRVREKTVLRTEVSSEDEFDDVVHGLEEHLEKEELWEKIRSKDRIVEELKKENYRISLDLEQLKKENQRLRKEIAELKGC